MKKHQAVEITSLVVKMVNTLKSQNAWKLS